MVPLVLMHAAHLPSGLLHSFWVISAKDMCLLYWHGCLARSATGCRATSSG